jgi:acetate kinase
MGVLALNCGSSSVKFRLFDVEPSGAGEEQERCLARGVVEGLPAGEAVLTVRVGERVERQTVALRGHEASVRHLLARLTEPRAGLWVIAAVGHRVVHGGEWFTEPTLIDARVLAGLEALEELAPLHNVPSLAGIRAARAVLGPGVPMVAVFDTAFHASLPERAARYAIPSDLAQRLGVRRFGFHGLSYQSVLARYCRLTGTPSERATVVALHLGNGCSAVAIKNGRSVDTSMGFTPLEGLVMGTRSGDLDPAIVGYLARKEGVTVETVEEWLNGRSGLLGLSGLSHDMRTLLAREVDHPGARLALEVFCYRARKYLGAYLAVLGGAQAIVFTGAIGENSPEIRARISEGMQWCGLRLDPALNARVIGVEARISPPDALLPAYVIPTDEELIIAQETARCVERLTT